MSPFNKFQIFTLSLQINIFTFTLVLNIISFREADFHKIKGGKYSADHTGIFKNDYNEHLAETLAASFELWNIYGSFKISVFEISFYSYLFITMLGPNHM
jgi:hypothetical protein